MNKNHANNNFNNFVSKLNEFIMPYPKTVNKQISQISTNHTLNNNTNAHQNIFQGMNKENQNVDVKKSTIFNSNFLNSNLSNNIEGSKNQKNNENSNTKNANVINNKILKDHSSNYHFYHKEYVPKNSIKKNNNNPLLKSYNPKLVKKENIDKKVIRKFRNYLIENFKHINFSNKDFQFWTIFVNESILPPVNYYNPIANEKVDFKSFNSKYLSWLFRKEGASTLYGLFIKDRFNEVMHDLVGSYEPIAKNVELNSQIQLYITNLARTFERNDDEKFMDDNTEYVSTSNFNNFNNYNEHGSQHAPLAINPSIFSNSNNEINPHNNHQNLNPQQSYHQSNHQSSHYQSQNHQNLNHQNMNHSEQSNNMHNNNFFNEDFSHFTSNIFYDSVRDDLENERQYENYIEK